jgi:hypothetical protein
VHEKVVEDAEKDFKAATDRQTTYNNSVARLRNAAIKHNDKVTELKDRIDNVWRQIQRF